MSEINSSNFKKEHGDLAPDLVGVTELTSPYFFVPPSGTTAERPENCEPGTLRFNTDIGSLEVFRGDTIGWEQIQRRVDQYLGGGTGSNLGTGTRGMMFNGPTPSFSNSITFLTVSTMGGDEDFGDTTSAKANCICFGGRVRAASMGGQTTPSGSSWTNDVDMVIVASKGDSTDYATLTSNKKEGGGLSNEIRALYVGGGYNIIESVTISQGGDFVDFGDLSNNAEQLAAMSSPTRGVFTMNSLIPQYSSSNQIEFVTMMSTGNSIDFGDMTSVRFANNSGSNATRGVICNGYNPSPSGAVTNIAEFLTISTTGNTIDFGDTTQARYSSFGSCCSRTRMVIPGGYVAPAPVTTIDSFEIATTGNAIDFGDLATAAGPTCTSNGHGGL